MMPGPKKHGAAQFNYEAYFARYQADQALVQGDVWKAYYRELLRMHSPTVVHIADGNLLDESRAWREREERFRRFLATHLPVAPSQRIEDLIGRLYAAHAAHTAKTLQPHNIEGAGFAYLTRALFIRFCGLAPNQVRIAPRWTTLPGYAHLAGGPHIPEIKPDIAVLKSVNGREDTYGVISLKWTIRHDRLKNAMTEAHELRNRKRGGRSTFIAFLTNEFALGRLRVAANSPVINCVYHVSLEALRATYDGEEDPIREIEGLQADGVLKDAGTLFANLR